MTTALLAQADPVFLMSWFKPLVLAAALLGWAWVISQLDKDAAYYYLPRFWTNLGQMGCGVVGFALMLLVPIFPLGLVLGLVVLCGGIAGYAYYRNTKVPDGERWSLSLDSFRHRLDEARSRQAQRRATLTLMSKDQEILDVPSGDDPRVGAHSRFQDVIDFALPRGASQIDLAVDARRVAMVVWIDGVKYPQASLEPNEAVAMIDYLKEAAGLDTEDRRKRQTGVVRFESGDLGRHAIAVSSAGSTRGMNMSMTLDGEQKVEMSIDFIGLLDSQKQQLKNLRQSTGKVVIIAVPPRQGGTTTMYSMLQEHDPYIESIVTFEKEVVFEIEGVDHTVIPEGTQSQPFNDKLNAVLRGDPNVVMISRPIDASTAQIIARKADETRFYVSVPARGHDPRAAGLGQAGGRPQARRPVAGRDRHAAPRAQAVRDLPHRLQARRRRRQEVEPAPGQGRRVLSQLRTGRGQRQAADLSHLSRHRLPRTPRRVRGHGPRRRRPPTRRRRRPRSIALPPAQAQDALASGGRARQGRRGRHRHQGNHPCSE